MPLIEPTADRLSAEDREAWEYDYGQDLKHRQDPWLVDAERKAIRLLRRWGYTNPNFGPPGYVSVSWGKDSVAVAHLAQLAGCDWPLVWNRTVGAENPDCFPVRDAFLRMFPEVEYHEVEWSGSWSASNRYFGSRRITGVRADESKQRRRSARVHGVSSVNQCRPILHWQADDVFRYHARHELPTHPAYAMTFDGMISRDIPRVNMVGTKGHGLNARAQRRKDDWENRYYPEVSPSPPPVGVSSPRKTVEKTPDLGPFPKEISKGIVDHCIPSFPDLEKENTQSIICSMTDRTEGETMKATITRETDTNGEIIYRRTYLHHGQQHEDILNDDGVTIHSTYQPTVDTSPTAADIRQGIAKLYIRLHQAENDPKYFGFTPETLREKIAYLENIL